MPSPHPHRQQSSPRSTGTVDAWLDELENRGFVLIEPSRTRIVFGQAFSGLLILLGLITLSTGPDPVVGLCAAAFIIGGIYSAIIWTKKHGDTDELVIRREGVNSLQTGTIRWEWITGVGLKNALRRPGYQVLAIHLSPEGVSRLLPSFGEFRPQIKFEGAITAIHKTVDGGTAWVSPAFSKKQQLAQLIETLRRRHATNDVS